MLWRMLRGGAVAQGDGTVVPAVVPVGAEVRTAPTAARAAITLPIEAWLRDLHADLKHDNAGTLASYIPELTRADPSHFGIAIATADGHVYSVGEADQPFTIQSVSKPFVYGLAIEDHGIEHVMGKVGVEPTGEAFNAIVLDEVNNRPFNPMVNAGAIATTSLVKGKGEAERFGRIQGMFERYAGRPLSIDESVFASERETGHRNRAIAYLELNSGMIEEPVLEHLDLYFRQCALLVTAKDLAVMAATLANNGVNPITRDVAIRPDCVKSMLSIMASCGMYDYSGEWIYRVGLPAKSGVGGGIVAVLPGQFGIGIYSPLLDPNGNSHRGLEACKRFSQRFRLHVYDNHIASHSVVRRTYRGGKVTSKRRRPVREQKILDANGQAIVVFELQGDLHFATAEQLLRQIAQAMAGAGTAYIVLDGRRVTAADTSALLLIRDMRRTLAERGGPELVVAAFDAAIAADWQALQAPADGRLKGFETVDLALEWCENKVLTEVIAETGEKGPAVPLALGQMDILSSLTPQEITRLEPYVEKANWDAGGQIIREGDSADRMYLLASGSAAVHISLGADGRSARVAAFGPGVAFGEFAYFDGGTRTADVIAEQPSTCFVLPFEQMGRLEAHEPVIHGKIVFALGRLLSDRLRRANAEVRELA